MCYPILIMAALTAAQAVASKRQQDVMYSRNANAIKVQSDKEQAALNRQASQQHAADTQAVNDAAKKSLHDMALFDTVAGEYGGGVSDMRAATIQSVQRGDQLSTIAENGQNAQSEISFQGTDAHDMALARLGTIFPGSSLAMGLQIAGAAASAYGASSGGKAPATGSTSTSVSGSDLYGYKGAGGF